MLAGESVHLNLIFRRYRSSASTNFVVANIPYHASDAEGAGAWEVFVHFPVTHYV